jgi:hypothetical protein
MLRHLLFSGREVLLKRKNETFKPLKNYASIYDGNGWHPGKKICRGSKYIQLKLNALSNIYAYSHYEYFHGIRYNELSCHG